MDYIKDCWNRFYYYIFDQVILYPLMKILPKTFNVQFMNFGYIPKVDSREKIEFTTSDIDDDGIRAHVNLYEKALSLCPAYPVLKYFKILEVGCGLGGGIEWIKRAHPNISTIVGVDRVVVNNSNGMIKYSDAHHLEFPDHTFDLVINIESSHLYKNPQQFFREVYRVLKPNGYFCLADLRLIDEVGPTLELARQANFNLISYQNITRQVINGINETSKRYDRMIDRAPWYIKWFKNSIRTTYCAPGTESYKRFVDGEKVYIAACWHKINNA